MFKRRDKVVEKELPSLTNLAYGRWLRASKPPLEWFLHLGEDEQETLAQIGEEWLQDTAIAFGYAAKDPVTAEAGIDAVAGDGAGEATLLQRLAEKAAAAFSQNATTEASEAPPVPTSFGGIGATRQTMQRDPRQPSRTPRVFGAPVVTSGDTQEALPDESSANS